MKARPKKTSARPVGRSMRRTLASVLLLSTIPVSGLGCAACEKAGMVGLSLMGGTINDPANKSLRRGMMSFALDRACQEMMMRPAALMAPVSALQRLTPRPAWHLYRKL